MQVRPLGQVPAGWAGLHASGVGTRQVPLALSQTWAPVQVPQVPPQPSDPHARPAHWGVQTHWPDPLQVWPPAQVPQVPPQPSVPQERPRQFGAHAHWPAAVQLCPPGHVPQDEAHPDGSAPHTRPVQQFDIGARQAPPEQTCPLGQVPSGLPGPHGVATQAPLAHSLPAGHVPHEPTLQVLGPQARPAQEQAVPLSTTAWVTQAPAAHACPARQSPHDP